MNFVTRVSAVFCCFSLCLWSCAEGEGNGAEDAPVESDLTGDIVSDEPAGDPGPDPGTDDLPAEDGACTVGVTGDPCSSPTQCSCVPSSARECLTTLSGYIAFPGGYCSARCTTPADCGIGANCAEITTGTRYCLKTCSSGSQCRMSEGYSCARIPMSSDTRTYCMPETSSDGAG